MSPPSANFTFLRIVRLQCSDAETQVTDEKFAEGAQKNFFSLLRVARLQ
jgi:hypothetical protein